MKRLISRITALMLLALPIAAQAKTDHVFIRPGSFKEFASQTDFFLALEPMLIVNTASSTKSAPSPIVYPLTIGASWPNYYFVSFQPRLSFFLNYYLWDNDSQKALPAEVENRTATSLSFLLSLPAVFSFHFTENTTFEAETGLSFLMRAGILSNGVSGSDSGTSGSAASDVDNINTWFWTGGRLLYVDAGASWLYRFSDKIKTGPELRILVPLGSLFSGDGLDAMMISTGLKLVF